MARIESDPNYTTPTFSRATAATDPFKKEDVQLVAAALSTHTHGTGKGLPVDLSGAGAGSIPGSAIADGSITSAKIQDGTIVAADIADATITNAKLGPDVARDNLLTNGGFEFWQRGNGPFTSNGSFTSDRWQINLSGTDTMSVARDTTNMDASSAACAACTFTKGSGSGSALVNPLNDQTAQLGGRILSFSVRVKTSAANAVRLRFYDGTTNSTSAYHTGNGTYQTLTLTLTPAANPSTLLAGVEFAVSCTAYIDNACLVVGSQPSNYVPLHPADDLARCLRYYEVLGDPATGDVIVAGIASAGGQNAQATLVYKAKKAVSPTVTVVGTWGTVNAGPLSVTASTTAVRITNTSSAAGPFLTYNSGAGNCITVEANP